MRELKLALKNLEGRRTESIVELGELRYSKLRGLEVEGEEEIVEAIQKLDKEIYDSKKELVRMEDERKQHLCPECKEEISINSKFCDACGASVNQKDEREVVGQCAICKTDYYEDSNFCFSCGNKI